VHLHIPKSAGSSLSQTIASSFAAEERHGLARRELAAFEALPAEQRARYRFVFGHLEHGVGALLPQGCVYVTVLRQPGPRLFSYFNYIKRRTAHPSHLVLAGQDMSFGSFLEYCLDAPQLRAEMDNGQMRRIAGRLTMRSVGKEHAVFREALRNIFAPDMVFGLTEHFALLREDLVARGLIRSFREVVANAAPERADFGAVRDALTPAQKDILDTFTRWDQAFYDICETHVLGLNSGLEPKT